MNGIFNVGSNSNNNYFAGLFGNNDSNSVGAGNFLGNYYSIKNGSYLKLAKKYYASEAGKNKAVTSAEEDKQTKLTKNSAENAIASISKLMDSKLYEKVEKKDENGNTVKDYDRASILKNVKAFVSDYNDTIKNLSDETDKQMLSGGVRLTNQTKVYSNMLAKAGLKLKADNTFELDEEAFNKADMTDIKSLFEGRVSFAKNIQAKLMQIYSAGNDAFSTNTYSASAIKNPTIGSMLDGFM